MILTELRIEQFRCLASAALTLDQPTTAIVGANGAGKTSLLEAAYFLTRGRSFRQSRHDRLVRHGADGFTLFGTLARNGQSDRVGAGWTRGDGPVFRINGDAARNLTPIAERLVVQVLEPELHRLVSEGPDQRRQFIDYGVFHVEPEFLRAWQRYRKTLQQRNAALRKGIGGKALAAWKPALIESAVLIDGLRRGYVKLLADEVGQRSAALGFTDIALEYRPGWGEGLDFAEALSRAESRDQEQHTTTVGPHRADLKIVWRARMAREQVSRGQQKLLAASLVLSQAHLLARVKDNRVLMLLDDPAAELDQSALERLMAEALAVPGQRIVTAINPDQRQLPTDTVMFHVEQGVVSAV